MTQTIEYVVKVNATQAQAAVAEVEKRFGGVDTVVARVDKSIIALERDMKDLNAAIAAGGPNVAAYKAQLEQLRTALYGAPGAVGGRGATSGMGAGMAALEASRALEDLQYGIGGVVNNIPSLVMALGVGAGAAGAISVLAVGINQVVKNFTAMDPAAKEAAAAAKEHVKGLRGEIEGLARELRALEVGADRASMEAQGALVQRAAEAAQSALAPLGGLERFQRLAGSAGAANLPLTTREQIDAAKKAMSELDLEMSKLAGMRRLQKEKEAQADIDRAVDLANAEESLLQKRNDEAKKRAEELSKTRYDLHVAMLEDEDRALREVAEARRKDEEARLKLQYDMHVAMMDDEDKALREVAEARRKDQAKADREANRMREREHKRTLDAMARAEQQFSDFAVSMASDTTNQMLGSFTDYLMMKAAGEKDAELKAIAGFMSQTGQMLVASGVRGMFEGAIISANPLTPGAGAGMIVTGAAAVGVGMAMAGGGAAIGAAIPSTASGESSTSATRDPGAAPRTSSGGATGGPMIINVSYGAGGPLPEDVAREIERVMSSGNRRRGAA